MGDKLKSGLSVAVNFTEGEIPSPAKLSAITSQVVRATTEVEEAVGDIHGESWPYTSASSTTLSQKWAKLPTSSSNLSGTAERFLDIANLARLVGPASNLNPRQINGSETIEQVVPTGVHEFQLEYPVSGLVSAVTTTDPSMTDHKSSATVLIDAGDWHVTAGGKVRSVTATAGGIITYLTNSAEWAGGMSYQQAAFNVIPDPNQIAAGGSGCSIGALDGQGRRPVTLPTATHQQANIDGSTITLGADDINQSKQLLLPRVLRDNLTTGDEIPHGFLYLKNETTKEVYEDAVYYYNGTSSVLVGNADLTSAIGAGNKFSILTVGTDITSSIDDLRVKTGRHSHDRSYGEPFIHISDLIGQYEDAGESGVFGPSEMSGNPFSQYLHRDGYRSGLDNNINDSNAMRGDIVFGITAGTPGSYVNTTGESYGVYFGSGNSTNPHILKNSDEDLEIWNGDGAIVFETANGITQQVVSKPVFEAQKGIIGNIVSATVGFGSNGLAPYAAEVDFTTQAISADYRTQIALGSDIAEQKWFSVSVMVKIPSTDYWIPGQQYGDATALIDGDTVGSITADDCRVLFWVRELAGVNALYVSLDGDQWDPLTEYTARVVIWYQPD